MIFPYFYALYEVFLHLGDLPLLALLFNKVIEPCQYIKHYILFTASLH